MRTRLAAPVYAFIFGLRGTGALSLLA